MQSFCLRVSVKTKFLTYIKINVDPSSGINMELFLWKSVYISGINIFSNLAERRSIYFMNVYNSGLCVSIQGIELLSELPKSPGHIPSCLGMLLFCKCILKKFLSCIWCLLCQLLLIGYHVCEDSWPTYHNSGIILTSEWEQREFKPLFRLGKGEIASFNKILLLFLCILTFPCLPNGEKWRCLRETTSPLSSSGWYL